MSKRKLKNELKNLITKRLQELIAQKEKSLKLVNEYKTKTLRLEGAIIILQEILNKNKDQ